MPVCFTAFSLDFKMSVIAKVEKESNKHRDEWTITVTETPSHRYELKLEYRQADRLDITRRYRSDEVSELMRIGVTETKREDLVPSHRIGEVCASINDVVFDAEDKVAQDS